MSVAKIVPLAGLNLPKSRSDIQQVVHAIALAGVPLLVSLHLGTNVQWTAWLAVFFAALDPLLSLSSSPDAIRKLIYGFVGAAQAIAVGVGLFTQEVAAAQFGAASTFLVALLAIFYTPTSTLGVASKPVADVA